MSGYRLSSRAMRDLDEITDWIAFESGPHRSELFRAEIVRCFANLASFPRTGHQREDLTAKAVLFRTVGPYLIVYRPDSVPLRVLRIVHGARDPEDLRDQVGERVAAYLVAVGIEIRAPEAAVAVSSTPA